MSMVARGLPLLVALVVALVAAGPAVAGTVSLAWDPVNDPNLAGYNLYYGTAPGAYTQNIDVGNVTSYMVSGFADCTIWYFAAKAYDTADNESLNFSNEISGWPRPLLGAASPASAEQGRSLDVTITGSNFQSGASVDFGDPAIVVNSVAVNSCTEVVANITVGNSAAIGPTDVEVINADLVFGTGVGLFTVEAALPPNVSSTNPTDGQTGISLTVEPTVTFSEAMDAASITVGTVLLLDASSQSVPQATGAPTLSTDGLTATITPASDLAAGQTYKIRVIGGGGGVRDLAGHVMSSTYEHSSGFETALDATPPTISSVLATNVGSTTADISWDTDEPADSQVFYRELGQSTYQQTAIDPQPATSHSLTLQGLEPSATYEYHVRSADAAGNASTSSPDDTFTTQANSFEYIRFEAEGGELAAPVQSASGGGAFAAAYIDTPPGTSTGTPNNPSGTATYGVNIPSDGTWYLWVRMYGTNGSTNSWFESVDGAPRQSIETTQTGSWEWVAGRSNSLTAGLHSVELGGHEAQARADRILITDDPDFVPTEQPSDDNTPPGPVTAFTATPTDGQNDLSWTNPADGDFDQTIVRYRTDGSYPTSPSDGFPVAERPAAPASADTFSHQGLTNGTTYHYGAFAIDGSGNASSVAQAEATPLDNVPPGAVGNLRRTDTK